MIYRAAIGVALSIGLMACGSNAEQLPADGSAAAPVAAVGSAAVNASKERIVNTSAGPGNASPPEGSPGYDTSVNTAMDAVSALFAPYTTPGAEPRSPMDPRPDYSVALNRAISAWRVATVNADVTDLSGVGWICSCQDWDATSARLTVVGADATERGYDVTTRFTADGTNPEATVRFMMIEEGGRWKVDDMILDGERRTLRALLAVETRAGG